jgi:hypothetical protein
MYYHQLVHNINTYFCNKYVQGKNNFKSTLALHPIHKFLLLIQCPQLW